MIVQTALDGAARFVIKMSEHTALSNQLADAFGNETFEPVEDEAARFIIANHDAGWADLDAEFRIDPDTVPESKTFGSVHGQGSIRIP